MYISKLNRLSKLLLPTKLKKQSSGTGQLTVVRPSQTRFIAYILLIFLPFISSGSASAQENMLTLPIDSSQFSGYYNKYDRGFEFYLRPEYEKMAIKFNSQEASVPIQRIDSGDININPFWRGYYEIGCFFIDDYLYKLVIYKSNAIGDDLSLVIRLNSYNSEGIMLDSVLLENRFSYEGVETFKQFKVEKNLISIEYYITHLYDSPDGIDYVTNPIPKLSSKAQYRIDNGLFILISKNEFKIYED